MKSVRVIDLNAFVYVEGWRRFSLFLKALNFSAKKEKWKTSVVVFQGFGFSMAIICMFLFLLVGLLV
jgi:hypothetical protein